MNTFKSSLALVIGKLGIGFFKFVSKDELFSKDEFELEVSKMRKTLIKKMQEDVITERAKIINDAVKQMTTLLPTLSEQNKISFNEQLKKITDVLYSEPAIEEKTEMISKTVIAQSKLAPSESRSLPPETIVETKTKY